MKSIILVLSLALVGCSTTRKYYIHPERSPAQLSGDSAQCRMVARQGTNNKWELTGLHDDCMYGKGWTIQYKREKL